MDGQIIHDYHQRAVQAGEKVAAYQRQINVFSFMRLGLFLLFILLVIFAVKLQSNWLGVIFSLCFFAGFGWLVKKQSGFENLRDYHQNLKIVNENEIGSIGHQGNIYNDGNQFNDEKHFYTSDLDIFGPASLFNLVNRAATAPGNFLLANWLSNPADKADITERQNSIKELGNKNDWKLNFQASILFAAGMGKDHLARFFNYLNIPVKITGGQWLGIYCKIAPYLIFISMALSWFNSLGGEIAVLISIANLAIVGSKAKYIRQTDLIAGKIGKVLQSYAVAFYAIEKENWTAPLNKSLSSKLVDYNDETISAKINHLGTLINKLNYHLNIIVAIFLNAVFLWDIKQVMAIEKWKQNNHQIIEQAFGVIAEFEALISLASLHINYPSWCFPEIVEGDGYYLTVKAIAHPLIPVQNRVANDFELNDTFKIDIITGSNMAGKSTFLRTLGINTILALCGAPVCAQAMQVSVMHLVTYMRIKDSLNESTSTFKAELDRLKMVLNAIESGQKFYFLIDEMLRGTNSVDKYKGSKAVIERLIKEQGVGLVATHDLQIAHLEQQYPNYVRNFYFDIEVIEGEMLFDYKIKKGECKTFNARLLLQQIGIELE